MESIIQQIPTSIGLPQIFVLLCIVNLLLAYIFSPKNLPPGPIGIPILGYLPWVYGKPTHLALKNLHKKFGDLISFYIGSRLVVVLGNAELVHEALVVQGDKFVGKPQYSPMVIEGDEKGISVCDGLLWDLQRCFVTKTLSDLGFGKEIFEPEIKEEIKYFLEELRKTDGKSTCLHDYVGTSIANNICILEFGMRFDYNDLEFKKMKHQLDELALSLEVLHIPVYFTWINKLPLVKRFLKNERKIKLKKELFTFIEQIVKQHENDFDTNEHRDLIYAWLDERNRRIEKSNSEWPFTRESLKFNLLSLFMAGTETTSSTLLTGIAYMAKNPDIQNRCRKEICDAIDRDRLPSMEDKHLLPFTEATILEMHRLASINPLGLVRSATEDTTVNGYFIPKETIIMPYLFGIHTNSDEWPDECRFKPERFLNDKNQVINKNKIMPFSAGKRMCLGSSLAKLEVFLYFTAILQNFSIFESSEKPIELKVDGSVVRMPRRFDVCVKAI